MSMRLTEVCKAKTLVGRKTNLRSELSELKRALEQYEQVSGGSKVLQLQITISYSQSQLLRKTVSLSQPLVQLTPN